VTDCRRDAVASHEKWLELQRLLVKRALFGDKLGSHRHSVFKERAEEAGDFRGSGFSDSTAGKRTGDAPVTSSTATVDDDGPPAHRTSTRDPAQKPAPDPAAPATEPPPSSPTGANHSLGWIGGRSRSNS
jgi:hypothetical protein